MILYLFQLSFPVLLWYKTILLKDLTHIKTGKIIPFGYKNNAKYLKIVLVQIDAVEAVEVKNGRQGRDRVAEQKLFDLILINWKMPEMDGLAT